MRACQICNILLSRKQRFAIFRQRNAQHKPKTAIIFVQFTLAKFVKKRPESCRVIISFKKSEIISGIVVSATTPFFRRVGTFEQNLAPKLLKRRASYHFKPWEVYDHSAFAIIVSYMIK